MFLPSIEDRMISTDPQTMTERERREEVAHILAAGLLRCVRAAKSTPPESDEISSPWPRFELDLSAKTRLSMAQRPTG